MTAQSSVMLAPLNGGMPASNLVEDHAERPDIGAGIDRASERICSGAM